MAVMNIVNFRRLDLNLLVVFQVLMEERHVTRAAARLNLSQGAVSAALGRLRSVLHDPLFKRTRDGMVPTPTALALAPRIGQALALLDESLSEGESFDPASSKRNFHLAMSDDLESVLVRRFLKEVRLNRWNVSFSFHQTNRALWHEALDDPKMDLVLCSTPTQVSAGYQQSVLFSSTYACIYDSASQFSNPITIDEYMAADHVRVSHNAQRGFVDEMFEAQGVERKVAVSVSHFAGIAPVLGARNLVATIPTYAADALGAATGATVSPGPVPLPRFTISMLWKVSQQSRTDHLWLRRLVERCVGAERMGDRAPGPAAS
ncbi:MAG: LysR family transcriptional regulator [Comamonadaceae bacterium]|nr:MAG: LysR family transcriptional regulator [Comamonadaceae bacterium]